MRLGPVAGLTAALAVAVGPAAQAQAQEARSEIPIREVVLSDGARRYAVPLTVGGVALEAGLDSGSTGLRVLPDALAGGQVRETSRADTYAYGSGARYEGVVAEADAAIGAAKGVLSFQQIKAVGCVDRKPNCPANRVPLKDYGIQGDGLRGEGFKAILGVNMAEADVASPLPALGVRRWIIELPLPGSGKPGRLILNPTAQEAAGYTPFHIDPAFAQAKGGAHDAIQACLINSRSNAQVCGPTLLDTGAPGVNVVNGDAGVWPNDTPAMLAFMDGGKARTAVAFAIGRREFASRMSSVQNPSVRGVQIQPGLLPYFAYSVLYDPKSGTVALKPRADTRMRVQ